MLGFVTNGSSLEWWDLLVFLSLIVIWLVLCYLFPRIFLRPLWWFFARRIYRLRQVGVENIPQTGGVLIVSNHVSYVDWLFIWMACPRRVRFVAAQGHTQSWLLGFFLRVVDSILIDARSGPKKMLASMKGVAEALDRGEVICVFPEGRLTRTGNMLPFHRGFEKILEFTTIPIPVIPTFINGMWGSIFSYKHGKVVWKWPEKIFRRVSVMFGTPLEKTLSAPVIRNKIQELSAESGIFQSQFLYPAHRAFVRIAAKFRQMFRPCLVDTTGLKARTISFLKALVGAIVIRNWLRSKIGEEKNVGVWLPSSAGNALTNIALAFLHRTSVNLNYTAGIDSIRSAVEQTGMKTIITSKRFLEKMPLDLGPNIQLIDLEDAKTGISTFQRLRTLLMVFFLPGWFLDRFVLRMGNHELDEVMTIIFSSGSTGEPKGVMLTNRNVASNADGMITLIALSTSDRILGVLPLFHSFGYTVTFWTPLLVGASVVFHADPRQAKKVGELCREHRCTIFLGTATFLRLYMRVCQPEDFKSLRLIVCGAEKLPVSLAKEFEAKFGILPLEGYGCTELTPVVAADVPDVTIKGFTQTATKLGTVGHTIPGVAGRIVDPETYAPLPLNTEGLLLVKGPNVMKGYLNKPELTQKVIIDGWYVTGDIGKLDEEGFTTLTGRLSRIAKVGGEMVPLEKLEEEIHDILGTGDRVVAVTSVPDEKKGERLLVLYLNTLTKPISEITKALSSKGLPNLWIPSERDFILIDEIPVLGSGKVDLRRLKDLAIEKTKQPSPQLRIDN
jgi:acyl-[acyl-carrier-protein]-phospholipid O-acyltransferase / long-chain-fatty-acid--[acyl-carrier-protein] ligase